MGYKWLAVLLSVSAAAAVQLNDETYYSMPDLFYLDNYEACLAKKGTFCMGSFQLTSSGDNELYEILQAYSMQSFRFNHTQIHRGYCISTTCAHTPAHLPPQKRFEQCVQEHTRSQYGLDTDLMKLDYCKSAETPPSLPIDGVDIGFLVLCGILLLLNAIGTAYDLFRNQNSKANPLLLAWSLVNNYNKLTHTFPNDDTLISRLNPIHGIKSITLIMVMFAHSVIVTHVAYQYNPKFLEISRLNPLAMILHNGTIVVQTFIVLSSFIFTHNFLLQLGKWEKVSGIKIFLIMMLRRIARITPLYMFMVGFTATWARFLGDGAMWVRVMEKESQVCRLKWWSHLLYIHNFYRPDDRCLLQSWFLAVDMQLYALAILLAIVLARWTKAAVKVLLVLFVAAIVCNFFAAYIFDLKAMVFTTDPELVKKLYYGEASFKWLYAAPWSSLPASLLGVLLGFLYYNLRSDSVDLQQYQWFRIMYRASVPCFFAWVLSGYFLPSKPDHIFSAIYAAIDRPIISLIFSVILFGFLYRVDKVCWRFMAWRSWQIIGRMSLCVLMTHWTYNLLQIGLQTHTIEVAVYEIGGHWFVTIFMTYITSMPLHLLVEMPVQKFLQAALGV